VASLLSPSPLGVPFSPGAIGLSASRGLFTCAQYRRREGKSALRSDKRPLLLFSRGFFSLPMSGALSALLTQSANCRNTYDRITSHVMCAKNKHACGSSVCLSSRRGVVSWIASILPLAATQASCHLEPGLRERSDVKISSKILSRERCLRFSMRDLLLLHVARCVFTHRCRRLSCSSVGRRDSPFWRRRTTSTRSPPPTWPGPPLPPPPPRFLPLPRRRRVIRHFLDNVFALGRQP